jgi:outer membrane lipoprotein-sorting protein
MTKATFPTFAAALTFTAMHLAAQNPPDARALIDGEADALQRLGSYQYTEDQTTKTTMQGVPVSLTTTITVQAVNPGKMRLEMALFDAPSFLMVSDGVAAWSYEATSKRYAKLKDASAAQQQLDAFARDFDGLSGRSANAKVVRSESLTVDGAPHDCWVVESRSEKSGEGPMQFHDVVGTVWIDKELGIVLHQTMVGKMVAPFGPGDMEMKSVKHSLKIDVPLDDALFHFTPPPGAQETDDLRPGGFSPVAAQPPTAPEAPPNAVVSNASVHPQAFVPLLNPMHRVEPARPQAAAGNELEWAGRTVGNPDSGGQGGRCGSSLRPAAASRAGGGRCGAVDLPSGDSRRPACVCVHFGERCFHRPLEADWRRRLEPGSGRADGCHAAIPGP